MAEGGNNPILQVLGGHAKQIFIVLEIKAITYAK